MDRIGGAHPIEMWGGVECTVNRVGDRWFDQMCRSGHLDRDDDLDRFAELGLRKLRYPVLWDHVAPQCIEDRNWTWADRRLGRLRDLGIEPIVGFAHHGSGPVYTNLLDPRFPEKLAFYAASVARRFPWVTAYTPVNEPLTTARFSCLYGHWYPHRTDDLAFLTALLNQCKGTALAMRLIRKVNPDAQLVQTEDLGFTQATPSLQPQGDFENKRRWLTWDLLCGHVDQSHGLWNWLIDCGVLERDLQWFLEHPCAPDVLGVNYYVTSERHLDEDFASYPEHTHGSNETHRYADIETVRSGRSQMLGVTGILRQTWERYRLPIAITEAHLGCSREEQCRWLRYVHEGATHARLAGADVRAVTAWSLLGSYDWNSLLTKDNGHYESGAFVVHQAGVRKTALAKTVSDLASGTTMPARLPGWWERNVRIQYPHATVASTDYSTADNPILITGGSGTLGRAFGRVCELRGLPYRRLPRDELDIACPHSIEAAIQTYRPVGIINAAGYVRVDDAETDRERCLRENAEGPASLANLAAKHGLPLMSFSSDLVFDGSLERSYVESDPTNPLNVYGQSKAKAEQTIAEAHQKALTVRTSAFFGPWDEHNFAVAVLRSLAEGREFNAASDLTVSPTYVPDLAHAALDLWQDAEAGLWHVANHGQVTWFTFARMIAEAFDLDSNLVVGKPSQQFGWPARRPVHVPLTSEKGLRLRSLTDAIQIFRSECEVHWLPASIGGRDAYLG